MRIFHLINLTTAYLHSVIPRMPPKSAGRNHERRNVQGRFSSSTFFIAPALVQLASPGGRRNMDALRSFFSPLFSSTTRMRSRLGTEHTARGHGIRFHAGHASRDFVNAARRSLLRAHCGFSGLPLFAFPAPPYRLWTR